MAELTTWEAIQNMRRLTEKGKSFSIAFEGYSKSLKKHTGKHRIARCVLRAAPKQSIDKYAEFKLYLFDLETKDNRVCWQPLITHFNDQKVKLL